MGYVKWKDLIFILLCITLGNFLFAFYSAWRDDSPPKHQIVVNCQEGQPVHIGTAKVICP